MGSVFRRRKRKVSVGRAWFNNQRLCWSRGQKATWRPAHLGHGSESRAVGDAEPARQDQKLQGVTTQPHQNRPAGGGEPQNPTPKTCSQKNAHTQKNAPPKKPGQLASAGLQSTGSRVPGGRAPWRRAACSCTPPGRALAPAQEGMEGCLRRGKRGSSALDRGFN